MHKILTIFGITLCFAQTALAQGSIQGIWQGAIDLPAQQLEIEVEFSGQGDELAGSIDIPAQGAKDLPLEKLSASDNEVAFSIQGVPGEPSFTGILTASAEEMSGEFSQNGGVFSFSLVKADPVSAALESLATFGDMASQAVQDFNVAGAAMAVVYKGQVLLADGYGYRDVDEQLAMDADTLFAIGSTTKAMTVTVLGMLVDDGLMDFDAPVQEYLPRFKLSDRSLAAQLTVRDLVTHRSGMPRHDMLWYNYNTGSRDELISRLAYLELTAGLRERFQYNNLMYVTAGRLGAKIAGADDWESLMRERLLEPLAMARTNFSVSVSAADANHAKPYKLDDEKLVEIPFRPIELIGPAGAVNSSVREMTHWLKFNLAQGEQEGEALLQAATLADIQAHHMPTGQGASSAEFSAPVYGMGWMIDTYRGKRRLSHGGGIDGFITSVVIFPDDDLAMVSFTNTPSALPQLLNLTAADRVLGFSDKDWLAEALQRQNASKDAVEEAQDRRDPRRKKGTKPSRAVSDFAGSYLHKGYGPLTIEETRRSLVASYNGIQVPLIHWHYDVWQGDEDAQDPALGGQKFLFSSNLHGEVAAVAVALEPSAAPIVFARQPDAKLFAADYLSQFVGEYVSPLAKLSVALSGEVLRLSVPGQPTYTLVPDLGGRFTLDRVPQVSVQFAEDGEKLVIAQPRTVIEATRQ